MKRTILADNGIYDLDSVEAITLSEDGTAIQMTMKSGIVSTLFSIDQITGEITNDPDFYATELIARALFFLQHSILHAAAYPEVGIDFESILEDMYLSMQPPEEQPEGEEGEAPATLELPFPTAEIVRRYLLTPDFVPEEEEEEGEEIDPYGDLESEGEWGSGGDEIGDDEGEDTSDDAACDTTPQATEDKTVDRP